MTKSTKSIKYHTTQDELDEFLSDSQHSNSTFLLFVAQESYFDTNRLKNISAKCYGAIFPQVIYKQDNYDTGIVSIELIDSINPIIIENINHNLDNNLFDTLEGADSIMLILDGLSSDISPFLENIFNILDEDVQVIGGGAGKLTLKQEPVIFVNHIITQNSALIIPLNQKIGFGVKHGWNYQAGPFIATKTDKNRLKSIDYKDAYEAYKEIVEKDSNRSFDDNEFFDIAKSYPLGIVSYEGEVIVRDPIFSDKKELILVGDIEENSVINILKGDINSLINSASEATKEAISQYQLFNPNQPQQIIMFDCISRVLFLEDKFKSELQTIDEASQHKLIFGALTLGEIANRGDEYIEFFNKTCIVGAISHDS
jgi:hypothetical protein